MHVRIALLAAVLAILLAAPHALAQAPGCSGTLSGAVTGAFDCTVVMGKAAGKTISFVLTPAAKVPGTKAFAPGALLFSGPLGNKTYAGRELDQGKATLTTEAGAKFTATAGKAGKGEMELTIAEAERYAQFPGRYVVNGTYQARLVPANKAKKGEVVVDVRFTVASDVLD